MFALYLIAGIAALIWGTIFVLRGSLLGGCLLYLLMVACFGYEFVHFTLGPVPLTLDRLVLPLVVVALIVQQSFGRAARRPLQRIDVVLAAFLGLLVLSAMWGERELPDKSAVMLRLLGGYLLPGVVYWITRQAPLDRGRISLLQGSLVGFGVYLAVTGLLEVSGQWWAVFPPHIADATVGLHFGRARGPMVHAVSFGACLGVCLLAAWTWQWQFGRHGRAVLAALMPLMLAGIYFSYTRSVWIGAALGLFVVFALTLQGAWRPLALGGMVSAGLLIGVTHADRIVSFQREQSAAETSKSADLRGDMAYLSWKMFLDRPLLGAGFDRFPEAKLAYLADRSSSFNLENVRPYVHHNTLLSLLTETGLVGLGLYLALLGGWAAAAWRLCGRIGLDWSRACGALMLGTLAVYLCQAVFHEVSYLPIIHTLVFFLAGVTVALEQDHASLVKPPASG